MRTLASEMLLNFLSKLSTECLPRSAVSHSFGKVLTFSNVWKQDLGWWVCTVESNASPSAWKTTR